MMSDVDDGMEEAEEFEEEGSAEEV